MRERLRVPDAIDVHHIPTGADLLALDHVGLSVADPDAAAAYLCDHVGMQVLARAPGRLVMGPGHGAATLTLADAGGPREPGALERLILRVADVDRAVAALPAGTAVDGDGFELAAFEGPQGLGLGFTFVAGGGIDYDLDAIVLRVSDPVQTSVALAEIGCVPRGEALHIADKGITLHASPAATDRPLLAHIALRVESIEGVEAQVRERGLEIDEQAPAGTFAIVLPGPERLRLSFVA